MGSIHEKNQGPKISCYCTFKERVLLPETGFCFTCYGVIENNQVNFLWWFSTFSLAGWNLILNQHDQGCKWKIDRNCELFDPNLSDKTLAWRTLQTPGQHVKAKLLWKKAPKNPLMVCFFSLSFSPLKNSSKKPKSMKILVEIIFSPEKYFLADLFFHGGNRFWLLLPSELYPALKAL